MLLNLGVNAADGSEGRWLVVAREMLQTGDYWHATINFYPYPDKPLLTYWFITFLSSVFNHHNVTEFIGRLPSVIAALGCIALTIEFARRLFTAKIAKITGYLMATSYSVIWYGGSRSAISRNQAAHSSCVSLK